METGILQQWWEQQCAHLPDHDFSVLGLAERRQQIQVWQVLFTLGLIHAPPAYLLRHCNSLLNTWAVMEQPSVFGLGSCECLGDLRSGPAERLFLVDAVALEARSTMFLFAVLSCGDRAFDTRAQRSLRHLLARTVMMKELLPASLPEMTDNASATQGKIHLSPRERQIVDALAAGCTNKEIARCLGTSPNTVRNQIFRLMQRFGLKSRGQLALLGVGELPAETPRQPRTY